MAGITSNNVANAIVKLVAADALPTLVGNLVMGNLVNRDYEPVLAQALPRLHRAGTVLPSDQGDTSDGPGTCWCPALPGAASVSG